MILSNFNQNDDGYIIQQSWKNGLIIKKVEICLLVMLKNLNA